jgi:transmembrane sensor
VDDRGSTANAEPSNGADEVKDQATAWLMLLTSGNATAADAEALRRWREQSRAHQEAFAEAKLFWQVLGPAATEVSLRADPSARLTVASAGLVGRRAFIGAALAASAAAVAYVGSKPPFEFWPSVEELRADYRTGTGEQRQVALAEGVSLILNTQTSIGVRQISPQSRAIELIAGEASFTTARGDAPIDIFAASGRASAGTARFEMRRDGEAVQVTCLDGLVEVMCHGRSVTVPPGRRLTYDRAGVQAPVAVDLVVATAWQQGQLIFRHERLARVVEEVNRYRPGRIILLDRGLGERDVVATFHLSRIDEAIEHLARAFGARTRSLPGGVVLLG